MYTAIIAFRIAVLCSSIKHDRCFTAGFIKFGFAMHFKCWLPLEAIKADHL